MELWVFDANENEALGIVESCERVSIVRKYDEPGRIEFVTALGVLDDRSRLAPGQLVWPKGGEEAFIIEAVGMEQRYGGVELNVKGRTLTALLGRRCLPDAGYYSGKAGFVVRRLCEDVFGDKGRRFPRWSMAEGDGLGEDVEYVTAGETLLDAVVEICKGSGLGVRTAFDPARCEMRLELYEGEDRFDEGVVEQVVIDPEFDSLAGLKAVDSVEGYANVVYVIGEKDAQSGVARKVVVDGRQEAIGERVEGLERFERAVRFSGGSVTDGAGSAIGKPPGSAGGSVQLTNAQYQGAMRAYAKGVIRAGERGVEVAGTVEYAKRTMGAELRLGDIVRVRARRWGVDAASRVRALEERYAGGAQSRLAQMGAL
ncbi:MAG: siphovirus ReqiPepy6 Gp37-like family protein [Oscillospiraceae bacterium]|jgi:hypothetical protein|nr:siphovirus ReqiPepy6 Gp37-like family protein [Oscillospiraceae bacterium]